MNQSTLNSGEYFQSKAQYQGSENIPEISVDETNMVLKLMKNNRVAGDDSSWGLLERIQEPFNLCRQNQNIPTKRYSRLERYGQLVS